MLDSLTGLALRRIAEEEMDRHWREYLQSGLPFSTALIDIDDFKRVNDTYGHHGGDQVLLQLAILMHQAQCSAYRWGGEEFLLLFPGLRKGDALPQTEALRQRVAQHRFRFLQTELTLSITIGLSDCTEVSVCSDAVNLADSRMYLGKRSGKNQVVWN